MNRRTFISAVGSAWGLIASPGVPAQQPTKIFRIGWLSSTRANKHPLWEVFIAGMRELGWIEGQNFTVENLLSEGRSQRLPALAAELVQHKVDLIVTAGTPPTTAAKNATATIPIVFYFVGDPVGSGLVADLGRPGGNITGLGGLGPGLFGKQLALLKNAVPKATHIAMMVNSGFPLHARGRAEVEIVARSLGLTLTPVELRVPEDIDGAFATIAREKVDALLILGQPFLFAERETIAKLALEQRLPAMNAFVELVQAGVLMSYAGKVVDDARRMPYYIDRILKGAKPSDLPVEQPTRFYLTINLKTAKAIGLTIPQSLLLRADEVIQ
ncbi:MAG: ABC transporter substrate-binding protein [Casimicrobiaceae bacterium]